MIAKRKKGDESVRLLGFVSDLSIICFASAALLCALFGARHDSAGHRAGTMQHLSRLVRGFVQGLGSGPDAIGAAVDQGALALLKRRLDLRDVAFVKLCAVL